MAILYNTEECMGKYFNTHFSNMFTTSTEIYLTSVVRYIQDIQKERREKKDTIPIFYKKKLKYYLGTYTTSLTNTIIILINDYKKSPNYDQEKLFKIGADMIYGRLMWKYSLEKCICIMKK